MPNPKRRHSSTRRDKRRTHHKLVVPNLIKCPTTGQYHIPHRAFWFENKLYYKGRVLVDKNSLKDKSA